MTPEYRAWLEELFAPLARVRIKRFFNLDGIWLGETMVGLVQNERIFLKTDEKSRKAFEQESASPFVFRAASGETIVTSYFAVPDRLYDEPQEFVEWARRAYDISLASPTAKKKRNRGPLSSPAIGGGGAETGVSRAKRRG